MALRITSPRLTGTKQTFKQGVCPAWVCAELLANFSPVTALKNTGSMVVLRRIYEGAAIRADKKLGIAAHQSVWVAHCYSTRFSGVHRQDKILWRSDFSTISEIIQETNEFPKWFSFHHFFFDCSTYKKQGKVLIELNWNAKQYLKWGFSASNNPI